MSDYQDVPPMLGVEKESGRELRYTVIKHSKLTAEQMHHLEECIFGEGIPTIEAVVVESDWPEYNGTYEAIKNRSKNEMGHCKKSLQKPDGLSFREGEVWYCANTSREVIIEKVKDLGVGKWNVYFSFVAADNDRLCVRDLFSFQVNYKHKLEG